MIEKNICSFCKNFVPKGNKPDGYCLYHKVEISKTNSCPKFEKKVKSKHKSFTQKALETIKK